MRFYACDLKSGRLIDEYPLEITRELDRRLGTYGSGEFQLPVLHPTCSETWREDLVPWRVLIVVTDDDDQIIWSGVPIQRLAADSSVVSFPCSTLEKYLDRRYMPDAEFSQEDQTSVIARAIAGVCGDDVLGVGLEYDMPPSGVKRDRTYFNDEDARVLTRLQQLSNVINGFEWTIDVQWADETHSAVRKVVRTGYPTLGYVTDNPELTFSTVRGVPGPVTSFSHELQWGDGDGATLVQAVGDGEGEDKPYSVPVIDGAREAAGWPRLEERQSRSGVIEQATLDAYAEGMAATYFGGQSVISFEATTTQWPTPADVSLGDSVRIEVDHDQLQFSEVWRVIGYSLSPNEKRWKPVIAKLGRADYDEEEVV